MGTVHVEIDRPKADVWEALIDADRYPRWLIGAQHTEIPPEWPQPGSSFEHRIGFGPLRVAGTTTSQRVEEPDRLLLGAGMGPLGESEVAFELEEVSPGRTRVTMIEFPTEGVVKLAGRLAGPLVDKLVDARNVGSLEKLNELLS